MSESDFDGDSDEADGLIDFVGEVGISTNLFLTNKTTGTKIRFSTFVDKITGPERSGRVFFTQQMMDLFDTQEDDEDQLVGSRKRPRVTKNRDQTGFYFPSADSGEYPNRYRYICAALVASHHPEWNPCDEIKRAHTRCKKFLIKYGEYKNISILRNWIFSQPSESVRTLDMSALSILETTTKRIRWQGILQSTSSGKNKPDDLKWLESEFKPLSDACKLYVGFKSFGHCLNIRSPSIIEFMFGDDYITNQAQIQFLVKEDGELLDVVARNLVDPPLLKKCCEQLINVIRAKLPKQIDDVFDDAGGSIDDNYFVDCGLIDDSDFSTRNIIFSLDQYQYIYEQRVLGDRFDYSAIVKLLKFMSQYDLGSFFEYLFTPVGYLTVMYYSRRDISALLYTKNPDIPKLFWELLDSLDQSSGLMEHDYQYLYKSFCDLEINDQKDEEKARITLLNCLRTVKKNPDVGVRLQSDPTPLFLRNQAIPEEFEPCISALHHILLTNCTDSTLDSYLQSFMFAYGTMKESTLDARIVNLKEDLISGPWSNMPYLLPIYTNYYEKVSIEKLPCRRGVGGREKRIAFDVENRRDVDKEECISKILPDESILTLYWQRISKSDSDQPGFIELQFRYYQDPFKSAEPYTVCSKMVCPLHGACSPIVQFCQLQLFVGGGIAVHVSGLDAVFVFRIDHINRVLVEHTSVFTTGGQVTGLFSIDNNANNKEIKKTEYFLINVSGYMYLANAEVGRIETVLQKTFREDGLYWARFATDVIILKEKRTEKVYAFETKTGFLTSVPSGDVASMDIDSPTTMLSDIVADEEISCDSEYCSGCKRYEFKKSSFSHALPGLRELIPPMGINSTSFYPFGEFCLEKFGEDGSLMERRYICCVRGVLLQFEHIHHELPIGASVSFGLRKDLITVEKYLLLQQNDRNIVGV